MLKFLCAISSPRSQVSERRNVAGSLRTCRLRAAVTARFLQEIGGLSPRRQISLLERERVAAPNCSGETISLSAYRFKRFSSAQFREQLFITPEARVTPARDAHRIPACHARFCSFRNSTAAVWPSGVVNQNGTSWLPETFLLIVSELPTISPERRPRPSVDPRSQSRATRSLNDDAGQACCPRL
jgi:hypothetical protein